MSEGTITPEFLRSWSREHLERADRLQTRAPDAEAAIRAETARGLFLAGCALGLEMREDAEVERAANQWLANEASMDCL